ncbi:putative transporter SVOPL [Callorhinchus milii]|uniref:putative transporter SVOPL n=1 Tax=Callorhinchus milii TaxID=7868 RepID=UPI001C3F5A16|nr:putative transporter SVOPL [Callorhinchus milii]
MVFFGFMVFSGIWGFFADRYGRWKILLLVTVWSSYYSLVTSFAHTYVWFIFLRSMVGCGVAGHSQGFVLMTEFIPSKYRGRILPLGQIFWLLGSTLEILLAYLIIPTLGWRWLVRISTFPSIVLLVVFKCIPESARFNVSVGNTQIATQTLQYIAKMNRVSLPRGSLVESGLAKRGQFLDLLDSGYRRTTLQSWFIWLGSAFSYYGLVLTSSELLENNPICNSLESAESLHIKSVEICHCKMFEAADYQTMIISTLGEFIFVPISPFAMEILGRRRILALMMGLSGIFFLLLNICTSRIELTIILFILRGLVSANFTIIYIYTAEVYPTTIRSLGLGSSSSMARIGAMTAPFIAQVLLPLSPVTSLCLFSAVCIVCSVLAFTLPIETKDREMQEMKSSDPIS